VFDHVRHRVWVVRNVFTEGPGSLRSKYRAAVREISETPRHLELPLDEHRRKPNRRARPLRVESNFTRPRFLAAVRKSKDDARAGAPFLPGRGRGAPCRVSAYRSFSVDRLEFVQRYSHLMHLVSALRSRLRPEVDCMDALAACFPAGTVSGAPKVRAMEIIDELEPTRRGIYAGAILYLDFSGNLDSCIAIRTMVVKNGLACVQAGAGLVADSVPEREYQETVNKARALIPALAVGQGG